MNRVPKPFSIAYGKVPEKDTKGREETLSGGQVQALICITPVEQRIRVKGNVGKPLRTEGGLVLVDVVTKCV